MADSPQPNFFSSPGASVTPRQEAMSPSWGGGGRVSPQPAGGILSGAGGGGGGTGVLPTSLTVGASIEAALRGEVKRLRDENAGLRRQAAHVQQLEDEVKFLRSVSILQHEEKVPIRLRELEAENSRLRKQVHSLQEKLRTMESEEYRQKLTEHQKLVSSAFLNLNTSGSKNDRDRNNGDDGSEGDADEQDRSFRSRRDAGDFSDDEGRGTGSRGGGEGGKSKTKQKVVILKPGQGPCTNCNFRLAVQARNFEAEKNQMTETISTLENELAKAQSELNSIHQWVAQVVSTYSAVPNVAKYQSHIFAGAMGSPSSPGNNMMMMSSASSPGPAGGSGTTPSQNASLRNNTRNVTPVGHNNTNSNAAMQGSGTRNNVSQAARSPVVLTSASFSSSPGAAGSNIAAVGDGAATGFHTSTGGGSALRSAERRSAGAGGNASPSTVTWSSELVSPPSYLLSQKQSSLF